MCIDARPFDIDEAAAFRAILPKYPADEEAIKIDLSGTGIPIADKSPYSIT